jgi:hypothetical protein
VAQPDISQPTIQQSVDERAAKLRAAQDRVVESTSAVQQAIAQSRDRLVESRRVLDGKPK